MIHGVVGRTKTHLHPDDCVDEEKHYDQQRHVRQCLCTHHHDIIIIIIIINAIQTL